MIVKEALEIENQKNNQNYDFRAIAQFWNVFMNGSVTVIRGFWSRRACVRHTWWRTKRFFWSSILLLTIINKTFDIFFFFMCYSGPLMDLFTLSLC